MLGRKPEREILCFSGKVAAAAEAVAAGVPLTCYWFLQGVLHCAVVPVCVGIRRLGTYGTMWDLCWEGSWGTKHCDPGFKVFDS